MSLLFKGCAGFFAIMRKNVKEFVIFCIDVKNVNFSHAKNLKKAKNNARMQETKLRKCKNAMF